jgi:hypothetical protein
MRSTIRSSGKLSQLGLNIRGGGMKRRVGEYFTDKNSGPCLSRGRFQSSSIQLSKGFTLCDQFFQERCRLPDRIAGLSIEAFNIRQDIG